MKLKEAGGRGPSACFGKGEQMTFSTAYRFNKSCEVAKALELQTGERRQVLTLRDRPNTFVVATATEHRSLYGDNGQVLWPN